MLIAKCDRCGTVEEDRRIQSYMFCQGIGYKPTDNDPLAQKFETHAKKIELCDQCYRRTQHFSLTLSEDERNQIVMLACMDLWNRVAHDNLCRTRARQHPGIIEDKI